MKKEFPCVSLKEILFLLLYIGSNLYGTLTKEEATQMGEVYANVAGFMDSLEKES